MSRRFVKLVVENYGSGAFSLHRLDAAKHLFYPSTAEAEAANAKEMSSNGGSGGDKPKPKPKPPRIDTLRRLPPPSLRFTTDDEVDMYSSLNDMFALLRPVAGGSSEGRILHVNALGHTLIYDADAQSISTAPSLDEPKGSSPIAVSVAGAGEEGKERLYVMGSEAYEHSFQVLDFSQHDYPSNWNWQPLPLPPPLLGDYPPYSIKSFTVVDGGRTICTSCDRNRTYCFDTVSGEWRHAGDWPLPFGGRAEYVPELNTWLGFCPDEPNHLCATDLTGIIAANALEVEAPALQHVWEDFTPPPAETSSILLNRRFPHYVLRITKKWVALSRHLVNLGSGRFCIAKVFVITRRESIGFDEDDMDDDQFALLTGVEVLRSGGDKGDLRMVKHKSKRYRYAADERIGWVL